MPLDTLVARHARHPDKCAVVVGEHRLTFAGLNLRVNRPAGAPGGLGIAKGDNVATVLDNSLEPLEVRRAAARTGIVAGPLGPLLRAGGLSNPIGDGTILDAFPRSAAGKTLRPVIKESYTEREAT